MKDKPATGNGGGTAAAADRHATRLLEFLEEKQATLSPLLIMTHDYPDPDALASALGLKHLAEQKFGINTRIVYSGIIGRSENREMTSSLKIPVYKFRPGLLKQYRNVALVDTQPTFKNNSFRGNRRATIVIDQHPAENPPLADLAIVDPECGATCVILGRALLLAGLPLPVNVATAIAYGILSDTLDLYRVKRQRQDVIQTYLNILPYADMKLLARIQNPLRMRPFFVSIGKGIQQAVAYRRLIVSHLGQVRNPDLVAQVAEFLLTYRRVNWTFCTGRYKGRLHVSLRSNKQNVPAGEILRAIFEDPKQAGGHGPIAGGSLRVGSNAADEIWQAAEQSLQARLAKRLRIPARGEFRRVFQP